MAEALCHGVGTSMEEAQGCQEVAWVSVLRGLLLLLHRNPAILVFAPQLR